MSSGWGGMTSGFERLSRAVATLLVMLASGSGAWASAACTGYAAPTLIATNSIDQTTVPFSGQFAAGETLHFSLDWQRRPTNANAIASISFQLNDNSVPIATNVVPVSGNSGTATTSFTFAATPSNSLDVIVTPASAGNMASFPAMRISCTPAPVPVTLTPVAGALPAGTVGVAYGQSFVAAGGTPGYGYAVSGGALPPGLTLAPATGALTGTPTTAGSFSFSVKANDSAAGNVTQAYSLVVAAAASTTLGASVTLTTSRNPSAPAEPVTFSAAVAGNAGPPTGTVIFEVGGIPIGTASLVAGAASITVSTFGAGTHAIVARYVGDSAYPAAVSATLVQTVQALDSERLRQMQLAGTVLAAQTSVGAIVGSIDTAIEEGFTDEPSTLVPGDGTVRLSYAPGTGQEEMAGYPAVSAGPSRTAGFPSSRSSAHGLHPVTDRFAGDEPVAAGKWRVWGDLRYTGWATGARYAALRGGQFNGLGGVSYRFSRQFLAGAFVGYEAFDQTSQALAARLDGRGWTVGSYVAWKPAPALRLDLVGAYTAMSYSGSAGAVTATFGGHRLLVSAGLAGNHAVAGFDLEPSLKFTALWLRENAYVDSAGIARPIRNAASGTFSGGLRIAYPFTLAAGMTVTPFVGAHADYQFSRDDVGTAAFALDGFALRASAGATFRTRGGARLLLDGAVGGIGNAGGRTYSGRALISIAF